MRLHFSPRGHDPRQVDLFAIIVLVIAVIGVWEYFHAASSPPPSTASFIVPSQTTRW